MNKQRKVEKLLTNARCLSREKRRETLRAYFRALETFENLSRKFFRLKADDLPTTVQDMLRELYARRMQAWELLIRGRATGELREIAKHREARSRERARLSKSVAESRAELNGILEVVKKLDETWTARGDRGVVVS